MRNKKRNERKDQSYLEKLVDTNDKNGDGIDDVVQTQMYVKHGNRKFFLSLFVICVMFIFGGLLFWREVYDEMNDTLKAVIWIVGVYCGANVAQDVFHKRG